MSAHPKDGGLNVDVSGLLSHWASEFQDSAENSRSAMDRHAHSMHADQFRAAQQQVDKDSDEIARLRARVAKLETVEAAARVYYEHYMQDEAADEDYCICGLDQHERAKAVRDSLHDLEPFTVKELRL